MRYAKKIPSADKELSSKLLGEGWKKLKEPSSLGMATLLSIPFMLINGFISMAIAFYLYPPLKGVLNNKQGFGFTLKIDLFTLIYIVIIFIFMAIHEFFHACFIPDVVKSDKAVWGINGLFGFALLNGFETYWFKK